MQQTKNVRSTELIHVSRETACSYLHYLRILACGASGNHRQTVENRDWSSFTVTSADSYNLKQADVAQLVEQSIRNRQVIGSSPIVGSTKFLPVMHLAVALGLGTAPLRLGVLFLVQHELQHLLRRGRRPHRCEREPVQRRRAFL